MVDIQFSVKELSRRMSQPIVGDLAGLKRLGRYLVAHPRVVTLFRYQERFKDVVAWTDTDFAGCEETRRSTSGGVLVLGSHPVKSWSTTQVGIALSSGEAEYYGLVRGTSMALGMKSLLQDLGVEVGVQVNTDASAAKGIASRRGRGKVRHIEVHTLWVQDKVAHKEVRLIKVDGKVNVADNLTKHVAAEDVRVHMHRLGMYYAWGRHSLAPVAQ